MLRSPEHITAPMFLIEKLRSVFFPVSRTRSAASNTSVERLHRAGHLAVVERADIEVEVLERLGAPPGGLRERRRRPAEHDPLGVVDAAIGDGLPPELLVEGHLLGGDVAHFQRIFRAANPDVGVHSQHPGALVLADRRHLRLGGVLVEPPEDAGGARFDERDRARLGDAVDKNAEKGRVGVEGLDENALAGLKLGRVADEGIGESMEAGIGHGRIVPGYPSLWEEGTQCIDV